MLKIVNGGCVTVLKTVTFCTIVLDTVSVCKTVVVAVICTEDVLVTVGGIKVNVLLTVTVLQF